MNLKKILTLDSVRVGLTGETKQEIIEELVGIIAAKGRDLPRDVLLTAVMDREKQMSTGINNGIAIPHGKTDAVTELHAVVAVSRKPVDFASLDKKPARIFIMTISPRSQTGPHLQFLAEVSRLLGKDAIRQKILEARSRADILKIFLENQT